MVQTNEKSLYTAPVVIAKVILDNLISCNLNVDGVYDDNPNLNGFLNQNFLGPLKHINKEDAFIIGIGDNAIRKRLAQK